MLSWWKRLRCTLSVPCGPFSCLPPASVSGYKLLRSDWAWLKHRRPLLKKLTRKKHVRGWRSYRGILEEKWGECMAYFGTVRFHTVQRSQVCPPRAVLNCHTYTRRNTHCPAGLRQAPLPLPLQVKRPTPKGHMTQPLAFLPVLLRISGVHETLRHPPLLSLAHARLLVAVAESRTCQEPCLGATSNDKMRMRARGWHMVLISSQVYL